MLAGVLTEGLFLQHPQKPGNWSQPGDEYTDYIAITYISRPCLINSRGWMALFRMIIPFQKMPAAVQFGEKPSLALRAMIIEMVEEAIPTLPQVLMLFDLHQHVSRPGSEIELDYGRELAG
ncbi:hypothetical protein KIL84_000956 [Mauremys mutica]|uniref:Uncharacterized protein n=1 Tax=Mauremys mutica TaxID=74926 RepID=A0A9D3WY84_9SAUR|nr:hypothetical protein KIL84_000956 [Mauremys mutica]